MYQLNYQSYAQAAAVPQRALQLMAAGCPQEMAQVFCHILAAQPATIAPLELSQQLGLSVLQVDRALEWWAGQGLLVRSEAPAPQAEPVKTAAIGTTTRLSRQEVNAIAADSEEVQFLLGECQSVFGRPISPTEANMLVSLHALHGLPVAVILMLVGYCRSVGRCKVGYIERTGIGWLESGIDTVEKADAHIQKLLRSRDAQERVRALFGIHDRVLTKKEEQFCYTWLEEYGFPDEVVKAAYEICVDRKGKVLFSYIHSILKSWYLKGYRTLGEVQAEQRPAAPGNKGKGFAPSFDVAALDQSRTRLPTAKKREGE